MWVQFVLQTINIILGTYFFSNKNGNIINSIIDNSMIIIQNIENNSFSIHLGPKETKTTHKSGQN